MNTTEKETEEEGIEMKVTFFKTSTGEQPVIFRIGVGEKWFWFDELPEHLKPVAALLAQAKGEK